MKKKNKAKKRTRITSNLKESGTFTKEKVMILLSLFLFAFGFGLIMDGKKIYNKQLKLSQRVNYKATLNPYTSN